jgi:hypothetical protein
MKSMKKFFLKLGLSLIAIPSLSIQLTAKDSFEVSFDTTPGIENPKPQHLRLPRKEFMRDTLPWNPHHDSMGLFPFRCGKYLMPISSRGTVTSGFMLSNESKGFHVRFDNPYKVKTVSFPRKNYMAKVRSRSIGMELGYYSHPSLHRNIYVLGNTQWKYQSRKHWNYSLTLGVGYSRTFLNNPTYQLKDGEFHRVPLAGYNYLALQMGTAVGYRIKGGASVYMGYSILSLAPYNWFLIPRKQFQLGLSLPASVFAKRATTNLPK